MKNRLLSKYMGDLHVHTLDQPNDVWRLPEERIGSNCANNSLAEVCVFLFNDMSYKYAAITNHSRDSSAKYLGEGLKSWLGSLGVGLEEIAQLADRIVGYGDERLLLEKEQIEKIKREYPVLSGIEVNVTWDGSLDTKLVDEGWYQLVIGSIHPWMYDVPLDVKRYQYLLEKIINNPAINIVGHIGYGNEEVVEKLDWHEIARSCIANQVAIEINLQYFITSLIEVYKLDLSARKISELIQDMLKGSCPLFSESVMSVLKEYYEKGLRLAINTDLHSIEGREFLIRRQKFSYGRLLVGFERAIKTIVDKYDIGPKNIINFLEIEELKKFLNKKYYG